MRFELLLTFGISLGLTLILELFFAFIIGIREKKDYLLVGMVNIITNPVIVLCYLLFTTYTTLSPVFIIIPFEVLAILVEAYYYKKYGNQFNRPFWFSLCANAFSYGIGLLLNLLF